MMKSLPYVLTGQGLKEIGTAISQAAKRQQDKGIKLQEYTIQDVVDDMEDARKAFGFNKINLSGGVTEEQWFTPIVPNIPKAYTGLF